MRPSGCKSLYFSLAPLYGLLTERARCAIARFDPQVGIEKHREFLENILGRSGFPLRQGLFEIHKHNMLIERKDALRLIARAHEGTAGVQDLQLEEFDRYLAHQYHLLLAFPQLDFEEQLNAMLAPGSTTNFLLSLLPLIKQPNKELLSNRFQQALDESDELALVVLMAFCQHLTWDVPVAINEKLGDLAGHGSPRVREQAISLIAASDKPALWRTFSDTKWRASEVQNPEGRERWDGSWILIKAARSGLLPASEAFDRIDAYLYGIAARELGSEAALRFGAYLDAAIRQSASFTNEESRVAIEMPHTGSSELELPRIRAELIESEPSDTIEAMRRILASDEDIREKSTRTQLAFRAFKNVTHEKNLDVLLHDIPLDALEVVARADPTLTDSWIKVFREMSVSQRSTFHHIGTLLANAYISSEPRKATDLLALLDRTPPAIWHTFGKERLTLSAIVVWGASDSGSFTDLRFQRLDEAANDAEIAMEVIAALSCGHRDTLEKYLKEKLSSKRSSDIARAVTICGLSTINENCENILRDFEGKSGFIGVAAKAAAEAYKRHAWACHWFEAMRTSISPGELWRYCQLFRKVVDARFEIVLSSAKKGTELFELYRPSIMESIHNRYEKRQGKRKKTLFGAEAPDRSFFERILCKNSV